MATARAQGPAWSLRRHLPTICLVGVLAFLWGNLTVITSPEEQAVAESRIRELNEQLRAIESAIDLDAWKRLFHEKLALEQELRSVGIGKGTPFGL